jgi:hypothetical protein
LAAPDWPSTGKWLRFFELGLERNMAIVPLDLMPYRDPLPLWLDSTGMLAAVVIIAVVTGIWFWRRR